MSELQLRFDCQGCGGALEFKPGSTSLVCPYCASLVAVDVVAADVKHEFATYVRSDDVPVSQLAAFEIACRSCATPRSTTDLASRCPSCKAALVVVDDLGGQLKAIDAVVPFLVDRDAAAKHVKTWTGSRWFAPNALKQISGASTLHAGYVPHWGYDDHTVTDYEGERGEYYYETETYTTTEDGKSVTKTRQVRHTRWHRASGQVERQFTDLLVRSADVPSLDSIEGLGPWPIASATNFAPELLAGVDTPRYSVMPADAFVSAKRAMEPVIDADCRRDIGGDEQRVHRTRTVDNDVLVRQLLLPLWLATYAYAGKTFDVFVNANTGKVIGERPYSTVKIALTVIAVLVAAIAIYIAIKTNQQP